MSAYPPWSTAQGYTFRAASRLWHCCGMPPDDVVPVGDPDSGNPASGGEELVLITSGRRPFHWRQWGIRAWPALRLTSSGIGYSPIYTGDFPWHVPWGPTMFSMYHRGPDGRTFYWCLYAPIVEGLDGLPPYIRRDWPMHEQDVAADFRRMIKAAGVRKDDHERVQAASSLAYFGTPVVINPYRMTGSSKTEVDAVLRERSGGTCTLQPPEKGLLPVTRPPQFF